LAKSAPIPRAELKKIAWARLKDAQCLYQNKRYDGAVYLCCYAVELGLKARICRTLKWQTFDPSGPLQAFKTHSFDLLLSLSGIEVKIKTSHLKQWSRVGTWEPDLRYKPVGSATKDEARELIEAAEALLRIL